jgi:hypothetical protein
VLHPPARSVRICRSFGLNLSGIFPSSAIR